MAKIKINFTIDEELTQRMDDYCDDHYLSRSAFLTMAVSDYLNAREASLAVKDLAFTMRKIADKGEVDEESLRELEDFERMAKRFLP